MTKLPSSPYGLAFMMAGIAFLGCNQGKPAPSLVPSSFLTYCGNDIVSVGFPAKFMVAGPGFGKSSGNYNSGTGGTSTLEQLGTRASTPAEAEEMMRKFCQVLQKAAEEKGCRVENPPDLPEKGPVTNFQFAYTCKGNQGEVKVTRTERTEKDLQVPGKQVYTVKVEVTEKIGKAP